MATAAATRAEDRYRAEFEALEREGAWRHPAWLAPLRQAALARFAETGFPTTRDEDWRYTSLAPLTGRTFRSPAPVADDPRLRLPAPLLLPVPPLFPIRVSYRFRPTTPGRAAKS